MSRIDLQKVIREQLNTLRVNVRPGTAAHESETLKAAALWDMFEVDLPGVIQARQELAAQDIAYLAGDADTEIDVA